jgi:hypothetical protein
MLRKTLICGVLLAGLAGCGSTYYKVTDPTSGRVYYTTGYQDLGYGQGTRFTDLKTGSQVTLTSTDIKKIDKADIPADTGATGAAPTTKP